MSRKANPGELRTPVYFKRVERTTDDSGYPTEQEINVFGQKENGQDRIILVKWEPEFGSEVFSKLQLEIREPVVVTMRYSPKINPALLVYKKDDPEPFEVISINNIENRNAWLEIMLRRKVPAR